MPVSKGVILVVIDDLGSSFFDIVVVVVVTTLLGSVVFWVKRSVPNEDIWFSVLGYDE